MKKRLTAFFLAVVMLVFGLPIPTIGADTLGADSLGADRIGAETVRAVNAQSAVPEYSDFLLYADLYQLSAVGHQISGGYACSCFALAYARTITDKRVHYYSEYNAYGADQYNVSAVWSTGEYYRSEFSDKAEAFAVMVEELQNQRPVLAYVKGRGSAQHFVTVIGFQNITSLDSLSEEHFLMIDPNSPGGFSVENLGDVGYTMKQSGSGSDAYYLIIRPYETVPTVSIASAVTFNRRYVSECKAYPCSVFLEVTAPMFACSLPCTPDTALQYDCVSEILLSDLFYPGDLIEAEGLYRNTEGEYWYRICLSDGTEAFVSADRCSMSALIPPELVDGSFPQQITGATYLAGIVRSNALINTVQAKVYRADDEGGDVVISSDRAKVSASAYSLKYSAVDYSLPFQDLKKAGAGQYVLVYEAEHTNYYVDDGVPVAVTQCDVIGRFSFRYGQEQEEPSVPSVCVITFDPNGGSSSVLQKTVEKGTVAGDLPVPLRDGYSFEGWYTAKQEGEQILPQDIITKDITLYARWTAGTHTHSFLPELVLPGCTEEGYTFYQCGCGYSFKTDHRDPTGHFYSDGSCIRCGESDPMYSPDAETDVVFRLGEGKGQPGETVRIPLTVQSSRKINSIAIYRLTYDTDLLEFVGFEDYEGIETKAFVSFFDNELEMITVGLSSSEKLNGTVCSLVFKIKKNAKVGEWSEIDAVSSVKLDSENLTSTVLEGKIQVPSYRTGDLDGDDSVDIMDSLLLFRHSMLPSLYPIQYGGSLDLNRDGGLDVLDSLLLFRHSMLPELYPLS